MENKIKRDPIPSFPEKEDDEGRDTLSSSIFSAVTHPSMPTRNRDDLLDRIRKGNDVLCRLPKRLDPNITFSDDDEEDIGTEKSSENKNSENKVPETPKVRQQPLSVHTLPSGRLGKPWQPHNETPRNPRQGFYSAMKAPNPLREKRVPLSEKKVPVAKASLMQQPEFKIPSLPPALHHTIVINGKPYSVLSQLGSGGSCKVFQVYDSNNALMAIKCVDLKGTDPLIKEGYKKEIEYLQKLQDSDRVIKLFDFEYRENELFLVLEKGEIDLARHISNQAKRKQLNPLTVKFYWAQMLEAVNDIHAHGIVHSDLKPANFLLVEGCLKLIDFGIATSVPDDKTSTFRDTQVGTLNYMSPEAVTQLSTPSNEVRFKVGVKSDVWSLGCILYNLVYGATPFQNIRSLVQKIVAITSPAHKIEFPALPDRNLVDVLKRCLERDVKERASVEELLRHPYLKEAPKSQDPSVNEVMAQMQALTPRRMSLLAKKAIELSQGKGEYS